MSAPAASPTKPLREGTLCSVRVREPYYNSIDLKPELLDDFVLNRERQVLIGKKTHKFLIEKCLDEGERFAFDLNENFSTYDPKPSDEGVDAILQYILQKVQPGQRLKDVIHGADFVCWRGMITKFAASSYEEGGIGFKYAITKFNDVFFLMELDTDARISERANETEKTKMFTYWGHKFETYIFAREGETPDPTQPVSTWEEMGAFFKSTFPANGDTEPEVNVFYSAEMDGLDSEGKHVEVKTQFKDLFVGRFFDKKAMKWWIQSKLVGIDDIVVGFRTDQGIVNRCKKVNLEGLRQKCKRWKGDVCLRTAQHLFNQIRHFYNQQVKSGEMLVIERKPDSLSIQYQVVPEGTYNILTEEFKNHFPQKETAIRKRESSTTLDDEDKHKKVCI